MSTASQGHDFTGYYLHEGSFAEQNPADSTPKTFGANQTFGTVEGSNNVLQVFQPNKRTPVDLVERTFEGSWSAQFTYTNPWWLELLYGSPSSTGTSPTTHTFDGETMGTARIVIGRQQSGKERILKGCLVTQATIQISVGGEARVNLNGVYAEEETNTPGSLESQPSLSWDAMTFADASLALGGSTFGYVQDGSLQLQNQVELVNEWGTRVAVDYAPRTLVPTVDFSKINEAGETDQLENMYGGSTSIQEDISASPDVTLTLDNGQSGSNTNSLEATIAGTFPESYGEEGLGDPQADVTEEINRAARTVSFDAQNNVGSAP
jgi:hypothetical protein